MPLCRHLDFCLTGWRRLWLSAWVVLALSGGGMPAVAAPAETVVLILKNGDRLTGTIVSQNNKRVVIQSALAGRVSVGRDHIEQITPAAPLTVTAPPVAPPPPPASPPVPAPTPTPSPVAATSTAPTVAPAPPALTNAVPATPLLPGWFTGVWTNWHGNVQAGLNLGIGTTDRSTMYANASAAKNWGRSVSSLTYNASYGRANGIENANQMAGTAKVDVQITPNRRTYAYGQGAAGYDVIRKIDLEYLGGGGLGYRLIDQPKRVLAGELGFQYQSFNYSTSEDQTTVAVRLAENFTTSVDKLSITQRLGFTPGIDDFSNYQINFFLTLSYPLFKPLTLNLNLINQYTSQPATGVQNNDLQIQTTLGITF